jgi:hypothetical protein
VAELVAADPTDMLGFYVGVEEGQFADLEVVAAAAIAWAQAVKAAAAALYPDEGVRISLIAAEPGSSRWLAKIEQSKANKAAEGIKERWHKVPAVIQMTIGLAVAWPITIVPTYHYYHDQFEAAAKALGLTHAEVEDAKKKAEKARADPAVKGAQRQVFTTLQRDPKITGVASGIPVGKAWKPPLIPSNQFAQADGLFLPQENVPQLEERTLPITKDVIVVAPRLEDKELSWTFKEEGLPPFTAIMRDKHFLRALDRNTVREQFRTKIPMRILLAVRQRRVGDNWEDIPRGRSVMKVLSPRVR